ncbi:histidine-phosphotransfer domain, HPT domain-containing protein, partial [Coccomyxa subellipsoidea C-169]
LQDDSNPDFVAEVVELYFEDSAGKLEKLDAKLAAPVPDFNEVDQLVHQFKGSSASFGAQGLATLCVQLRDGCMRGDRQGCQQLLQEVKRNFNTLKGRLEIFMQLETQRKLLLSGGM